MKPHFLTNIKFLIISINLLLWLQISGQESLQLLTKLDMGLPKSGLNGSRLGEIISYLGDINNDGFDDWAVGIPNAADYKSGEIIGKVYIYFGNNVIPDNKKPDLILVGNYNYQHFGHMIAQAGDINNDGFSDFIIASDKKIELFYGGNPMDTIPDTEFTNEHNFNLWGISMSTAGDVNNDGFDDIIIGGKGNVSIYLGGLSMDPKSDIFLKGERDNDFFGFSVSNAGDFNNDGFDDVVVGAQENLYGDIGRAYLYFGGLSMDSICDFVMTGERYDDCFGSTVAGAGDLNNDSFDDLLVSAYRYQYDGKESGRTYIYYGGDLNDTIADIIIDENSGQSGGDINNDGFLDLLIGSSVYLGGIKMDNIPDIKLDEIFTIAGMGDYNNDGYSDILGGNSYMDNNVGYSGVASVFWGSSLFDTIPDVVFYGEAENDYFGELVSCAGDLNNDGYNDFIIGSPGNDKDAPNGGSVYVYFGGKIINNEPDLILNGEIENGRFGESGSYAGDVNGDGFDDIIVGGWLTRQARLYFGGQDMDSIPDIVFNSVDPNGHFGNSVSNAGDFNGDGFDDLIIGDFTNSVNGTQSGRAFLYFGGLVMDTIPDLSFNGETKFNNFGESVSYAGDLNNDGFDDVIITAPNYDVNDKRAGRIYIYYGNSVQDNNPDVIITGTLKSGPLSNISYAGDVNNDGFDDILVGAPFYGNSPFGVSYVHIYFGGNITDTIADITIDKMQYGFGSGISVAGDLNDDGYDDIMVGGGDNVYIYFGGSEMDTIADLIIIKGENPLNEFGNSLSFLGDLNKDGFKDILVGDASSNAIGYHMGRAYIYSTGINTGIKAKEEIETLFQVYPNPFSSNLTIQFKIQNPGRVLIKIFNSTGQEIETLAEDFQAAGLHRIEWQPKNLTTGMYFCNLQTKNFSETKKLILHN